MLELVDKYEKVLCKNNFHFQGGFMELENKDICTKCGGKCCKKSGCDYFVSDFDLINKNRLLEILATGNVSITSALNIKMLPNGQKYIVPFLYLRARNKGRDVIDLFSLKRECIMLTSTGCSYSFDNRPGGGANLIPDKNGNCHPYKNPYEEMVKWAPYQSILSKLVKRYTGKSVDVVLKENIEQVCIDVLTKNFDGVSSLEIEDITSCIGEIVEVYPDCYKNALEKARQVMILKRV